jgi:acetyl esterase/lipase
MPALLMRIATLAAAALLLNLHYVLFGRPFLEGPLTSRPFLALGNTVVAQVVKIAMAKQGVPRADRTETYSFGEARGQVDIYEPEDGSVAREVPRTAVIWFHSGAFIAGGRSFGAGVCSWLASHGAVCLSASYRTPTRIEHVASPIPFVCCIARLSHRH